MWYLPALVDVLMNSCRTDIRSKWIDNDMLLYSQHRSDRNADERELSTEI